MTKVKSRKPASRKRPVPAGAKNRASKRDLYPIAKRDVLAGDWFKKLVALQARLHGPGGCPWDREQTHESLRKYLIEEAYETLDAMDSGNPVKFSGELGDVLLQVVFHSILAEKAGAFTISDVIQSVHDKMVRRHPHVFADATAETSAAVLKNWEQIKAKERADERSEKQPSGKHLTPGNDTASSVLAGVPRNLPSLLEAYQLSRRAAHIGFDWNSLVDVMEKLDEEKNEILRSVPSAPVKGRAPSPTRHTEEEVGDLFFVAVNIARHLGVDPEIALKKANRKFVKRFNFMESRALQEGVAFPDVSREHMEELWEQSKVAV